MADPGEVPAVKRPLDVIVPSPVTDQFAATLELNWRVLPSIRVTVAGETVIGFTMTEPVPVAPDPLWAVAVTVAVPCEIPAVKRPLGVMVPSPVTDHVDGTLAVNWRVVPAMRLTVGGVTDMAFTVTEAVLRAPDPSVAVAVMVADPGVMPAVKRPPDVMVPSPVADHVTATLAENRWVVPSIKVAVGGVIATVVIVTAEVPVAPEPSVAVAVTVAEPDMLPAVNKPEIESILPSPVTDQTTWTLAVNCCIEPAAKVALLGVTITVVCAIPVWPKSSTTRNSRKNHLTGFGIWTTRERGMQPHN